MNNGQMMLSQRNRNKTCVYQGIGGRTCVCCDDLKNKKNRRAVRRVEKQRWAKEVRNDYNGR